MERLNNLPPLRYFRKELRKKLTPAEAKLWTMLQGKQIAGKKFRRQHSFGRYIMDFYCASDRLAIELDGEVHNSVQAQEYDAERTLWLEQFGIRVLRFENKEIFDNPEYVLGTIRAALEEGESPTTPAFGHPSFAGGEQDVSQSSHPMTAVTSKTVSKSSPPAKGEYGEAGRGLEYYDAAVLLEKIKAEKAKLIAAGKIKKEKPLPPIEPGEMPFTLPEGWVWTRLGAVIDRIFDGPFGSHLKTADYKESGVRVIRLENLARMVFRHDKRTFISKKKYETIKQHTVFQGDLIIGSFIADGVKCVVLPKLDDVAIAKADCFCIRINHGYLHRELLMQFLSSPAMFDVLSDSLHGMTRQRINTKQLRLVPIPLPPLAEQHAIVERVDKLLAMVDQLEKQVAERRGQAEQLMQAVLREAFG